MDTQALPQSWAKTQLKIILNRIEMVKMMASLIIRQKGGNEREQKSAAFAAIIAINDTGTAEEAIQSGIRVGMAIMRFNGKNNA